MHMRSESTELEEYIRTTLGSIAKGVHASGDFRIQGLIEFDLAVTNTKEGKGGFKIYVVGTEAKQKSEKLSHIKFKVKPYARSKQRL